MSKATQEIKGDIGQLVEDTRAFMAATADVAGEKVASARERLSAALERGGQVYDKVRDKAVEGVHAADGVVHENVYKAVGFAAGMGFVIGFILGRQISK